MPESGSTIDFHEPDPDDPEIRTRFFDIKDAIQGNRGREVSNYDVLDVLFELFWVHHEQERPAAAAAPEIVADGGQTACDEHPDCEATVTIDGEQVCAACQLETARRQGTTTDGPFKRCPDPDCRSAKIHRRTRAGPDGYRYWCEECGNRFDQPIRGKRVIADGGVAPVPEGRGLTMGEFARENPAAVVVVLVGLAAWAVFLWWIVGVFA